jgi:chlorophyll synthase
MTRVALLHAHSGPPAASAVVELLKPITWFPPMWAFLCGAVSSGQPIGDAWLLLAAGLLLTGPAVCGTSQAINDWFDRHVDAINEPGRPIPSGRVGGRWGLVVALAGSLLSLLLGFALGPWIGAATAAWPDRSLDLQRAAAAAEGKWLVRAVARCAEL